MTINQILGNSVSALSVNQAALRTTSQNIANVNNPDYVRRETIQKSVSVGGQNMGVGIAEIRRLAADFLARELVAARSSVAGAEALVGVYDRVQGLLGPPDSETSLPARINSALAYASELTLDPVSGPRRVGYLQELSSAASGLATLAKQVQDLRAESDLQVASDVMNANALIEQIHTLNSQIGKAEIQGNEDTTLKDDRDAAIRNLAEIIDIQVLPQKSGAAHIVTADGFALVTEARVELEYQSTGYASADSTFSQIMAYRVNPSTGLPETTGSPLDPHVSGGSLNSHLTMRDMELPGFAAQLGELSAAFADQLNSVHNESVAVPPPNTLSGRNTGLVDADSLGFTGSTTIAIVDAGGALVRRVDVDFTAGTLTVNGGAPAAIGATLGTFEAALNTALGGDGSASFTNGQLVIDASNAAHGVGVMQPDTSGSARAGRSFGHFFGLNDLMTSARPSHFQTGLAAGDAHAFAGGTVDFVVRDADGNIAATVAYTLPGSGATFATIEADLDNATTGLGTYFDFTLDANGEMTVATQPGFTGYQLDVSGDSSARTGSGVSLSELFGLGRRYQMEQARDIRVVDAITQSPDSLALAKLDITGATVVGDIVATKGDGRGAEALQAAGSAPVLFRAAGGLASTVSSIGDYSALVVASQASLSAAADRTAKDAKVIGDEVELRRAGVEGVNLDEELAQMIIYQQAYNAAARMITVANEVYAELINIAR